LTSADPAQERRQAAILIVDDDLRGSRSIATALTAEGHAVRTAGSGAEALAEISRAPPDLILLDVMMPGMDGFEVVRRLKADPGARAIPVIMLTALDDRESKLRALEDGAEEFLAKPADRADLLARVRNLLRLVEYRTLAERRAADLAETNRLLEAEIERRRQIEKELLKANAQLAETNEELRSFSHSVSHDLRRPVRAIEGFSGHLMKTAAAALDAAGLENLRRIETAAEEMNRLIDALLILAHVTAKEMQERAVDLSALARRIAANLQRAEPGRAVRFTAQADMAAQGDPGLLRVALTNLLDNAWKFTRGRDVASVEFGCHEEGGETVYCVRDNGAGFDMQRVGVLFGAFRRLHPAEQFPGEGIGLATVRRAIARHRGRVWAEGAPGRGAAFYFTLP
jgi:signal transduction histidine kinase